ncbi:hypothetical protein RN001_002816 [Aquatica leii]|uniref:DDE Tnp4 domain-containing protein n=1 Tax=Aquatica leii TaxID=1421715 RepID=A0AAN7SSW9_9COLE|nr:hypothetical protein RN001_002816 [Aquatica leii]
MVLTTNYKGQNSIVLLAFADATYKFTYVNLRANGRISDGVFQQCQLSNALQNNSLNLPPSECLPGGQIKVPYMIVADDAFPLGEHLIKPYPQRGLTYECRIFNYRLSRARRIIENSFGILVNRFRVLLSPINLSATKVEKITLCCVILHNFLCTQNRNVRIKTNIAKKNNLHKICQQGGNQSTNTAREIRDELKRFFNSPEGKVEWQDRAIANNNM